MTDPPAPAPEAIDATASRASRLVQRFFPGLEARTLLLGSFVALILTLYWRHGSVTRIPRVLLAPVVAVVGKSTPQLAQHVYSHLAALVLLFLVPLGVARLVGLRPRDLGLGARGAGRELLLVLAMWLAFVPVVYLASRTPSFMASYPRLRAMSNDPQLFAVYQTIYLSKWLAWEFFFRGFMLFGFERDFGRGKAVVLSTIPFVLMHYTKPEAEMLGAILAGPVLCAIALRSRSIWPGVVLHWLVAASMDFFASRWWR